MSEKGAGRIPMDEDEIEVRTGTFFEADLEETSVHEDEAQQTSDNNASSSTDPHHEPISASSSTAQDDTPTNKPSPESRSAGDSSGVRGLDQVAKAAEYIGKASLGHLARTVERTVENYMGDGKKAEAFRPLEMFQQLNFCGTEGLARLTNPSTYQPANDRLDRNAGLHPLMFRHTHSTPLHHSPSFLNDEHNLPPAIGLDKWSRSRSTPLTTSANSAFGTILRTMPYMERPDDRSAFLPPYRVQSSSSQEQLSMQTTFNPIKSDHETEAEPTSIEVMDIPKSSDVENEKRSMTTATRAAKFMKDVRNIGMRRRIRGGRENPARPPSSSDESAKKTHADEETLSSKSSSNSGEKLPGKFSKLGVKIGSQQTPKSGSAQFLLRSPKGGLSSDSESPSTVASPTYQQLEEDERPPSQAGRVRIQVATEPPSYPVASPEPSQMEQQPSTRLTPPSGSPGTRCSSTTHTSGQTTANGTTTSCSSGFVSHLSSISETDREVMEVNEESALVRAGTTTNGGKSHKGTETAATQPALAGYVQLTESPLALRDGANVQADRFFTFGESPSDRRLLAGRQRPSSSLRRNASSQSSTTVSSTSMTTNSSLSSSGTEPPTFVSYLDRKTADLTSLRELAEASSPRSGDDSEERESSPAEFLGGSDVLFVAAKAPKEDVTRLPRPVWPGGFHFGRRVRSLPPRSPHKGRMTPTTPPPNSSRTSPVLSPPRNIVDHQMAQNISRPHVLRSVPVSSQRFFVGQRVSPVPQSHTADQHDTTKLPADESFEVVRISSPADMNRGYYLPQTGNERSRTYQEHNIEILKTDSKDESSPTFSFPRAQSP